MTKKKNHMVFTVATFNGSTIPQLIFVHL
uniref:Uncharacterized protein n=1 Tax=Arundo donax TaxID=35708 RepID=A0A0A9F6L6_ARUDO